MYDVTYKVTAKKVGKLAVDVQARDFTIRIDEPEKAGGENTGMNPVELYLGSLGACTVITASAFARQCKVVLDELWVEVEGDLDKAGQMGYNGIRPGYQEIRLAYHFKSSSPQKNLAKLLNLVETRCPVRDCVINGVPIGKPKYYLVDPVLTTTTEVEAQK